MKAIKKIIPLLILLVSISVTTAQNGINYKAVIKDDLGNVVASQSVDVQFSILQGAAQTNVYTETHAPTTDANGIMMVNIGEGTTSDVFTDIDWASADHFLNVQIDTGSGLVDLGTTQFMHVPYAIQAEKAANVSGLEAIDEGNGIGWRLVGGNPGYYGDVGFKAVDLSYTNQFSSRGATGDFSIAMGFETRASGDYSAVFGSYNAVYGDYSFSSGQNNSISNLSDYAFAYGSLNYINGERSLAFGRDNSITDSNSFAFGEDNDVRGQRSATFGSGNNVYAPAAFAFGDYNTMNGYGGASFGTYNESVRGSSFIAGRNLTSHESGEVVFGQYNTNYTPNDNSISWNNSNRLFVVANGYVFAGQTIRRNALTILRSGNIGIGTDIPDEALHINGRLKIGSETIEDTGFNRLSFNADLFPTADNTMQLGNASFRWQSLFAVDGTINTSDRRSKTNIATLNYGLKEVMKLNPVSFNWKTNPNEDTKLGLIAQDLLEVIPEVVKTHDWETDENGTKIKKELERMGVYYSDLVPVLIKAIQEQQVVIESQNLKIDTQNKNFEALLSRIEALEINK